jgi:hypothetical protein
VFYRIWDDPTSPAHLRADIGAVEFCTAPQVSIYQPNRKEHAEEQDKKAIDNL